MSKHPLWKPSDRSVNVYAIPNCARTDKRRIRHPLVLHDSTFISTVSAICNLSCPIWHPTLWPVHNSEIPQMTWKKPRIHFLIELLQGPIHSWWNRRYTTWICYSLVSFFATINNMASGFCADNTFDRQFGMWLSTFRISYSFTRSPTIHYCVQRLPPRNWTVFLRGTIQAISVFQNRTHGLSALI